MASWNLKTLRLSRKRLLEDDVVSTQNEAPKRTSGDQRSCDLNTVDVTSADSKLGEGSEKFGASRANEVSKEAQYCQLHLGSELYVVAKDFKGQILIHIREYRRNTNGKLFHSKRGIALDLEKWKKIKEWYVGAVDQAVQDYRDRKPVDLAHHLGRNVYLTLKTGHSLIHVRRWFLPDGKEQVVPTRTGVTLTFEQWAKLKDCMLYVQEILGTELDRVEYCETSESHQCQEGFLQCASCNPNQTTT